MILYVDASAVVALIARQGASEIVGSMLMDENGQVVFSDFAMAESSAALARLGRIERWPRSLADSVFAALDEWAAVMTKAVEIVPDDIKTANDWIRRPGVTLRAPDAAHIAAAHRLDATIVTLDRGMGRAATALGVACINPAETLGEQKD